MCTCFSRGLDSTGRRDIGLKFSGSIASFFFGKGVTLASFSTDGKIF